jgi:inosine-uridine nucleoside N-ribohydrolase
MTRLVIDTDPGVDDAQALMMTSAHPGAQVEVITTVAGNVPLARTTANACTILDVLEWDVPAYAGCGRSLAADPVEASIARKVEAHYVQGELAWKHRRGYTAVDWRA